YWMSDVCPPDLAAPHAPEIVADVGNLRSELALAAGIRAAENHRSVAHGERVAVGDAEDVAFGIAEALRRIAQPRVLAEEGNLAVVVVGMLPLRHCAGDLPVARVVELEGLQLSAQGNRIAAAR